MLCDGAASSAVLDEMNHLVDSSSVLRDPIDKPYACSAAAN